MSVDVVTEIISDAIFVIIKTAAVPLMISLVVGLAVSIFQTVTSIQEQTLTFVPKVLCLFLGLMLFGHWMLNNMINYMVDLWSKFSLYVT